MLCRLNEGLKNTCKKIESEFPILYNLKKWYKNLTTIEKTLDADRVHVGSNRKIADSSTMLNRNDNNRKVLNNLNDQSVSDEKGYVDVVQSDHNENLSDDDELYGNDNLNFLLDDDDFYGNVVDFSIDNDDFYETDADFATDEMSDNHNLNKNEVDSLIDYKLTKNNFYGDGYYSVADRSDDNSFDYINEDEVDFLDEVNKFDGDEWINLHDEYEYDEEFTDVKYVDKDKVSEGRTSKNE